MPFRSPNRFQLHSLLAFCLTVSSGCILPVFGVDPETKPATTSVIPKGTVRVPGRIVLIPVPLGLRDIYGSPGETQSIDLSVPRPKEHALAAALEVIASVPTGREVLDGIRKEYGKGRLGLIPIDMSHFPEDRGTAPTGAAFLAMRGESGETVSFVFIDYTQPIGKLAARLLEELSKSIDPNRPHFDQKPPIQLEGNGSLDNQRASALWLPTGTGWEQRPFLEPGSQGTRSAADLQRDRTEAESIQTFGSERRAMDINHRFTLEAVSQLPGFGDYLDTQVEQGVAPSFRRDRPTDQEIAFDHALDETVVRGHLRSFGREYTLMPEGQYHAAQSIKFLEMAKHGARALLPGLPPIKGCVTALRALSVGRHHNEQDFVTDSK